MSPGLKFYVWSLVLAGHPSHHLDSEGCLLVSLVISEHSPHRLDLGGCLVVYLKRPSFRRARSWNCWTYLSWVKPIWWANSALPMIFLVVSSNRVVGGSRTGHWSWVAMEKSPRLKGSAMLACVGTRLSICLMHLLLCQVQCDPRRLFKGVCLPEPLMMA